MLLPFCLFGLNLQLSLLGPKTHSLRACLSLCPSSNCVLSLSIALDTHLLLLILGPLSSTLLFARLPRGNLGEPNIKHTLRSFAHLMLLCRHHTFERTDCPLLPFLSVFSPALALACLLRFVIFFFIDFKRGLLLVFFPRPAPNHPIFQLAHFFRPQLLLRIR